MSEYETNREIDILTQEYNSLVKLRHFYVIKYDLSADGSEQKQDAIRHLVILGQWITNVETRIDKLA